MGEEYRPEAKFNAAIAKLKRIDYIRQEAHRCRWNKDYDGCLDRLMSWAAELNERLNKDERSKVDKFIGNIRKSLNEFIKWKDIPSNFFSDKPPMPKADFIIELYNLEKYLGVLEKKFGMSIPDAEDPRKAILER